MNNDKNTQIDPLENLKKELVRLYENTDDNIISVGYGCKSTGGVYSEEKCISFGVAKKLPEAEISPEKIIPKNITVDGIVYKTDVYERKIAQQRLLNYNGECQAYQLVLDTNDPNVTRIYIPELNGLCGNRQALFYSPYNPNDQTKYITIPNGSVFCFDRGADQNFPSQFSGVSNNIPYHFLKLGINGIIPKYCCNECDGESVNSDLIPGAYVANQSNVRPLKGGVSIFLDQEKTFNLPLDLNAGTLGGIVIDSLDGKMVGITNAHVSGRAGENVNRQLLYKNEWAHNINMFVSDTVLDDVGTLSGYKIGAYYESYKENKNLQPAYRDGAGIASDPDEYVNSQNIGTTKRVYADSYLGFNEIDCALINLNNSIVDTNSWKQVGLDALTIPAPFATTAEIDSITINTPVMTSGRTSGPRGTGVYNKGEQNSNDFYAEHRISYINPNPAVYTGSLYIKNKSGPTECSLMFTQTSTTEGVRIGVENYYRNFTNILEYQSRYPNLTDINLGGDSGSLMYAFIKNQWKIVGLLFAGAENTGLACRIDRVAELMKVEPYLGTPVDATPNAPIDRALPYEKYKSVPYVDVGNKKYWLVGRTQLFPNNDAFELKPFAS